MDSTDSKVIGAHTYTVHFLPPRKSLRVGTMLGRVVASSSSTSDMLGFLDPKVVEEVADVMAEVTLVDGKRLKDVFDAHFVGKAGDMVLWLAFALEHEFADALKKIESLVR